MRMRSHRVYIFVSFRKIMKSISCYYIVEKRPHYLVFSEETLLIYPDKLELEKEGKIINGEDVKAIKTKELTITFKKRLGHQDITALLVVVETEVEYLFSIGQYEDKFICNYHATKELYAELVSWKKKLPKVLALKKLKKILKISQEISLEFLSNALGIPKGDVVVLIAEIADSYPEFPFIIRGEKVVLKREITEYQHDEVEREVEKAIDRIIEEFEFSKKKKMF